MENDGTADASAAAESPRAASIYTAPDSPLMAASFPASPGTPSLPASPGTPRSDTQSSGPATDDDAALHLRLKLLDERVFDVEAAPSMSVADFRLRVAEVTEVPAARQRLIYRGKLLKDGAALAAYDLKDGHTVHLVAKPVARPASTSASSSSNTTQTPAAGQEEGEEGARARGPRRRQQQVGREVDGPAWNLANLRSALRRNAATGAAAQRTQPLPMLREILDEMSESPQEAAEGMGLGTSATTGPRRSETATLAVDLEPISQGILTMRTVLSTAAVEEEDRAAAEEDERVETEVTQEQSVRRRPRQFFVGQWLDVKDTVNQWLESTVMDIADGKVLIHYHGWPARWDEWIDFDSDRIAAFRTRTLHTQNMQRMSPVPTTRVPSAPRVGDNDVRRMVVDVRNLMREMMPHIDRLTELCEDDLRREREQNQPPLNPVDDAVSGAQATETGLPTETSQAGGESRESEVSEVAHLVAPLFDRFGRLLMDSARYFDPLLRPELRGTSQRQQERRSTALRYGHGGSAQRQAASVSASMEALDNSLSIRDLITTSPTTANESNQPRRSIDVHIHAIVAPASFASLARGSSDAGNGSDAGVSTRSVQTPSTPPIGRSFGFNDSRSADTTDDDVDHSRVPLLSSYRHRSHSQDTGPTQQERAAARDLDNFLADDFFGTSFGRDDDDEDDSDDDSSTDSDVQRMVRSAYRPPSPSGRISSPRTPQSQGSADYREGSIGVIPEVAEAEERLRARAAELESSGLNGGNDRTSSASAGSSASSSSSGFPTFLEVMRRTLSGVRNLVHHDTSAAPAQEASHPVELVSGFSLPSSSSSSSSSLSPPASPSVHSSSGSFMSRPRSPSSASSIEEDLDLDEVD
ncbi:hypothetical protein PHYSODRAFT_565722 [Phytophthora sojae]|uniref:Ubiquitin-like domain-containing protein n=1 Tax=Phytophthora sojae (strain P6497) TaxID=1094619 RepID=G5ABL1_PHYSP|nr:hypothetical protein PHYSODRAFT_565722 [Phytophthora sojae]EGZ06736.1 hypothetical protein PHYSODRAFT_565722 [Phytophthora sojae]|eukprot:XP_009537500.1 hypothetical protein PHYSODRAFT_565722 [Phytophthora sojae]